MLAYKSILRLPLPAIATFLVACGPRTGATTTTGRLSSPEALDSIPLRAATVSDSVVIRSDSITILLSMRDVEERAATAGYDPTGGRARFFRGIRNEYEENGWAQLKFEGDAIRLAGELIVQGKASIRVESSGSLVQWVRVTRERNEIGSTWRSVYLPSGEFLLRLVDRVVISVLPREDKVCLPASFHDLEQRI